jgi:glycine cleavage system H protein
VNSAVVDDPGLVNRDPFSGGWLFKIKLASPAESDALLSPAQYAAQIGTA